MKHSNFNHYFANITIQIKHSPYCSIKERIHSFKYMRAFPFQFEVHVRYPILSYFVEDKLLNALKTILPLYFDTYSIVAKNNMIILEYSLQSYLKNKKRFLKVL